MKMQRNTTTFFLQLQKKSLEKFCTCQYFSAYHCCVQLKGLYSQAIGSDIDAPVEKKNLASNL